jgi:N6-adenosine-specific RNA methylase IME4/DNA-binding XRE family transcriptional regulator
MKDVSENQLLQPLASYDYDALREDIRKHGVKVPVIVDRATGLIVDGHHRMKFATECGRECPIEKVDFDSPDEADFFAVALNVKRRRMSLEQRRELALELCGNRGWTQDRAAEALGVDQATVSRWVSGITNMQTHDGYTRSDLKIPALDRPLILERYEAGETQAQIAADYDVSQAAIAKAIAKEKQRIANEILKEQSRHLAGPAGQYNVIVIDPPWEMQKIEREVAPNQANFDYPTMDEDELADMTLPAADDCHLFCWTTHKHLPMALRLLDAWGFRYVLTMVWHKPGGFQPFGLPQYNCEFAVYGRKGSPKFIDTKAFNTCFEAPRREHSRKPDEFYDVIRRVTGGSRIDIFSRENRDGFDCWGNEAGKFSEAV